MKQLISAILTSLSYVAIPSMILSLGIGLINGRYISTFLVTFALIFLIGLVTNSWYRSKILRHSATLDFKKRELELQQSVEAICTACKTKNVVPIKLSERNTFKCSKCNIENLILFEWHTAVVTEPIKLPQIGASVHA